MNDLPQVLEEVLRRFYEANIDFVLVGGSAMVLHGVDTTTFDVDISFAIDTENCEKVCQLINRYHPRPLAFPPNAQFTVTPGLLERVKFLNLKTDLGDIDLLPLPGGVDSFAGLKERATLLDMDTFSVRIASLDDLIAMKQAANRPKDQTHLKQLLALQTCQSEPSPAV